MRAPDTDLVERLSHWAQTDGRRRFWSVAHDGTGRTIATLPTSSDDFTVAMWSDGALVHAAAHHAITPAFDCDGVVGLIDENPAELFGTTVVWLRETATSADGGMPTRAQCALASALLAAEIGDTDGQREAARIAADLSA